MSGLVELGMSARRSRQFSRQERKHKDKSQSQSRARASKGQMPVRLAKVRETMTRTNIRAQECRSRTRAKERFKRAHMGSFSRTQFNTFRGTQYKSLIQAILESQASSSVSTGGCTVFINKPKTRETYIWKNMLDKR
jgi:hypothetical protein